MTEIQTPDELEKIKARNKRLELNGCKNMFDELSSLQDCLGDLKERVERYELPDEVLPLYFDRIESYVRTMFRELAVIESCADENSPRSPLEVMRENLYGKKRIEEDGGTLIPMD